MANREAAERACKDPNPIIDGRKANVNLAYLGAKPRGIQSGTLCRTSSSLQRLSNLMHSNNYFGLRVQCNEYHWEN